ncbi:MAG: helix-turn-helix transcriptional regulator [Cyanobacteria bacterium P01_E01_bin.42]
MGNDNTEFITISFKIPKPKGFLQKQKLTGKIAMFCRILTGNLQKDLAKTLNIGKNRLSAIESGTKEASHEEIKAIAQISGQSLDIFNF